jgi:uncharacterized membrane protein
MKDFFKWYKSKMEEDQPEYISITTTGILAIVVALLLAVLFVCTGYVIVATNGLALLVIPVGIYMWYKSDNKETNQ